ncbi:MAG: S4 domain-containing protein YaaA [Erysipelotrichaceae bacterium]|nr:S4 domain-containing protein YaaA [Erysipelotrichaceae bacterium]
MALIKQVEINDKFITLGQFIKITDHISSGGEAKLFLYSHEVYVNNEKEDRRGRKLYHGDQIRIGSEVYQIC